ncbi:MAG TPA: nucleotidyltransferase domain-containing protein [Xanthobacteraceae bacterium]|nr:nucleotidyltransferase domain-containing protein [Xanthobacteraceae bacterium]
MKRDELISRLRAHEQELRAAGVTGLALFGSAARGEQRDDSDVDVVVKLSAEARSEGFAYFGRLDTLNRRLTEILDRPVDIVVEPIRKEGLRQEIERDQIVAF